MPRSPAVAPIPHLSAQTLQHRYVPRHHWHGFRRLDKCDERLGDHRIVSLSLNCTGRALELEVATSFLTQNNVVGGVVLHVLFKLAVATARAAHLAASAAKSARITTGGDGAHLD